LFDRHLGADVAIGATLGWEATTMRYALLMHYGEPGEGEISEEAIAEAKEAFGAYGRALEAAGVLLSADVLQPSSAAVGWAEKCPGAQWGVIEVRPTATAFVNGAWTR
jgi:hypothetical protein